MRTKSAWLLAASLAALHCKHSLGLLGQNSRINTLVRSTWISPAEGSRAIGTNARIAVGFDKAMDISTLTVNTQDTACTGSLRVSADNFASCVRMAAQPVGSNGNKFVRITPAANLMGNSVYKIALSSGARAQDGSVLDQAYSSSSGFRTAAGTDTRAPGFDVTADFLHPYDTATNVPTNTGVFMAFVNEPIDPATATVSTSGNACTGSIQLSPDNFASCLPFRDDAKVVHNGRVLSLYPRDALTPSTSYKLRLSAAITDLSGNAIANTVTSFSTGAGTDNTPPAIFAIDPNDGASNEYVTSFFQVDLTGPMDPATVLANFENNACAGSVQVSTDNFLTCVRMARYYIVGPGFNQYLFFAESPLNYSSTYKVRLTSEAKNVYGTTATPHTQANGFSTQAGVTGNTIVNYLVPLDNSFLNEVLIPFGVNFSKPMQPGTITVNTTNTVCAGYSLQVSADSFTTCLIMQGQPVASANNTQFTAYPQGTLTPGTTYRTRITTAALDFGGSAIAAQYNGSGIQTRP